jgi:plasmid stabilization system protein ParE
MAHSVHITARALNEIDEGLAWLAQRSVTAARRWHEKLLKAVRSLEHNPARCGLAPEGEWYPGELRQLLHGKKRRVTASFLRFEAIPSLFFAFDIVPRIC